MGPPVTNGSAFSTGNAALPTHRRDRAQRWVFGVTAALAVGAVSATSATAAVLASQATTPSQGAGTSQAQAAGGTLGAAKALRPAKQALTSPSRSNPQPAPAATSTGS
jgi:hypothetical protein